MVTRKTRLTDVHMEEAAALRRLWDKRSGRISQAEFAERFDIGGQSALSNFLAPTTALSLKAAVGFARGFGCDIAEFSPRLAKMAADIAEVELAFSGTDFVQVHRVDVQFSNGHGTVRFHEDDKPPLSFRKDFLHKLGISPGNAVVVDAEGVSNDPYIRDGAVVLINRGDTSSPNGDFYAFRADGELLIKRLTLIEGVGMLAVAANPSFSPKQVVYRGEQDFEVIGRAVWTGIEL